MHSKIKLGTLVNIKTGKLDANASSDDGIYPFFTCAIKPLKINDFAYDCECVLVAGNGDLNVKYYKGKFNAYQRTYIIESKNNKILNTKFLFWFLSHYIVRLRQQSAGGVIKFIKLKHLTNAYIIICSIDKQKDIANTLENINKAIENEHNLLIQYDELIKSRFIEMFGDIKTTPFDVNPIEVLCEFVKDGTHQTPVYIDDKINGYKFVSSKDVTSGKIDWDNVKYIPSYLHEKLYKNIRPQLNDILLAKNGTTGIAALVDTNVVFDIYVSVALLRFKKGNPVYWLHAINCDDSKKQFDGSLIGVGVPNLHLGRIKKVALINPPIDLQNQFADFVKQIDKLRFISQKRIAYLEELLNKEMDEAFN